MELTEEHYKQIASLFPVQQGMCVPKLQVISAVLYVANHG